MTPRENLKILSNEQVSEGHCLIKLFSRRIARSVKPGQFVQVTVNSTGGPLLARPFSVLDADGDSFLILYRVVGQGTRLLAQRKRGESIPVIGPLGNGFGFKKRRSSEVILVGGGVGIPPLYYLARSILGNSPSRAEAKKVYVVLGGRKKGLLHCRNEFRKMGVSLHIATDDGSAGSKGVVTDVLEDLLVELEKKNDKGSFERSQKIYACGPKPMLKTTAILAEKFGVDCEVSLEEVMACGFGACLGCAVKTKRGYLMSCKDGPVFNAKDVVWE